MINNRKINRKINSESTGKSTCNMSSETPAYNMPIEFCGFPRKYRHELAVGQSYIIRGRNFEWSVQITERHATQLVILLHSFTTRRLHDGVSQSYSAEPGNYRVIPIDLIDERIDQDDPTGTQQFYHFFQVPPPPPISSNPDTGGTDDTGADTDTDTYIGTDTDTADID
jgi:hypothetical protein